jgi:pimeloyl-ACP methyl ester carboxylesterase
MATAVLVHGGFHGGWCWRAVSAQLARAGWTVFAPSLTGLGERAHLATPDTGLSTHIDDVLSLIECEELTDVVLCGHSAGGTVITGVADRIPDRIAHLVYLDALIPRNGESALDVLGDAEGIPAAFLKLAADANGMIPPSVFTAAAFGVTDAADAEWLERRMRAHPLLALTEPIRLDGPPDAVGRQTYVRCEGFPIDFGARMVERAKAERNATVHVIPTGHDVMIIDPEFVTRLITS